MPLVQKKCMTKGCKNLGAVTNYNYKGIPGLKMYRHWCSQCHSARTGAKHGLSNIHQVVAKNAGFVDYNAYSNSTHVYRKHRKNYCENIDGRLGITCTATIEWDGMLDVDHKNGDPTDNRPRNLQTLCKNCHAYKTSKNKDSATPGRKKLGVKY